MNGEVLISDSPATARSSPAYEPPPSVMATPAVALPETNALQLRSTLETLKLVVAPTTLLTGLLFYFGWEFTNSRLLYFGIDHSLLGYSTQDYLLRSIDPVVLPVSVMLLLGVVLVSSHAALRRWIGAGIHLDWIGWAAVGAVGVGVVLFVMAATEIVDRPIITTNSILTPLNLGFGVGAVVYGFYLRGLVALGTAPAPPAVPRGRSSTVIATLVTALIVLSLFAATGQWAKSAGYGRARQLAGEIGSRRPTALLYSKERLHLRGPGVAVQPIGDEQSSYRFRYTGLKLLVRAGGKFFFLPSGWAPGRGTAIVLPDDDGLRVEYVPPLRRSAPSPNSIKEGPDDS